MKYRKKKRFRRINLRKGGVIGDIQFIRIKYCTKL